MNARSVFGLLLLTAVIAAAQAAPEKKLKEGEYDPYNEVFKDVAANNFTKALTDLDVWAQKFPETEYKEERTAFYVQAYAGTGQAAKALDTASGLFTRDLATIFPGPNGQATVIRLLFNVAWAISH